MRKLLVFSIVIALVFMTMPARAVQISNDIGMYYYADKIPVTNGNYYYVGSAGSSDGAGSNGYDGTNPRQPMANINNAIDKCTAASTTYPGDVIVVLPRHTEDIDAATDLVPDIAGIHYIGLGKGDNRPKLDFTGTSGSILISGAGTTFENFIFEVQIDNVVEVVDVGADDVTFINCEFRDAAGTSGQDFIMADTANEADRLSIIDCLFTHLAGTENGDSCIYLDDAQDRTLIKNCTFTGDCDPAPIYSDANPTNIIIEGCRIENIEAGKLALDLGDSATGFIVDNLIYTDDFATAVDPGGCWMFGNKFSMGADVLPIDFPTIGSKIGDDTIIVRIQSGSDTTFVSEALCGFPNDYFNYNWVAKFTDSDGTGLTVDVTDFAAATGTLTVDSTGETPAAGDVVILQYDPLRSDVVSATDLTNEVPDGSVLSYILDDAGDTSSYDDAKHSLYAIGTDTDSLITSVAALTLASGLPYIALTQDSATDTTSIIDVTYAGYGNDYFNTGWVATCVLNADSVGNAPEGQTRDITDYDSTTGDFTTAAFSAAIGEADKFFVYYDPLKATAASTDLTNYYPDNSAMSWILDDGGDTSGFVGTSHSLVAIGTDTDAIIADFTDYDLDHLSGVADGGTHVYPDSVVQDSVLAYLMGDDDPAVVTTYNNTTDSLEAISNALAAGTGCTTAIDADGLDHLVSTADGTGVYPASVVEDSILAKILGDDATAVATTYNNTTDSLEAIGSKTEFITHVATCTTTAAATTDNMFDVGGPIIITAMFGICTVAAADDPGDMTLEFDATTGADYDSDFSTTVTVNALGAGDAIHFTNAISEGVLTLTANTAAGQPLSWICGDPSGGVIEQTLTSTGTMNITWYMTYIPLTATSTVAAST